MSTDGLTDYGYNQQFTRTLKSFTSFAIGFSFISITSGIFTTFAFLLATAGPRGLWMWIPAAVGQLLITFIYAHLAARIPLTGSTYQWASRLAGPKVGWIFGWLSATALVVGVVATNYGFVTQAFMPLLEIRPSLGAATVLTICMAAVEAGVIIFSTKLTAMLNAAAVATELLGVIGLSVVLLITATARGKGSVANLASTGIVHSPSYYHFNGPFMLAVLLGSFTITGFEAAANLAEETQEPTKVVPKAMIRATLYSGLIGMLFLIALVVAIPNVAGVSASATPITDIMQGQLGAGVTRFFLVIFCLSLFANSLVIMLSGSRMVFAMARDQRFPASRLFSRVSRRHDSPIPATLLILTGLIVIMLIVGSKTSALSNLFTAATVMFAFVYLATVILFAATRHRLPDSRGVFNLGRAAVPVIVASLIWLAFELCALLLPAQFHVSGEIAGVVLVLGVVIFAGFLRLRPSVFSASPPVAAQGLGSAVPAQANRVGIVDPDSKNAKVVKRDPVTGAEA